MAQNKTHTLPLDRVSKAIRGGVARHGRPPPPPPPWMLPCYAEHALRPPHVVTGVTLEVVKGSLAKVSWLRKPIACLGVDIAKFFCSPLELL